MLSILIPTYNYNIVPLVQELYKQCLESEIVFEILCQDDGSKSVLNSENEIINSDENCSFFVNKNNLGRGKNINSLAEKAKYNWLLILDCDTFPTQNDFIKKYNSTIKNSLFKVVFGGILYKKEKPEKEKLLRWVYGNKREALSLKIRSERPNSRALTSNLLIQKELFLSNKFDETIINYGYEDLVFMFDLSGKDISVEHIDNTTYHLGLETSQQYLDKTKIALKNLVTLQSENKIDTQNMKIIRVISFLKTIKATSIISKLYELFEKTILKNLTSDNPSLLVFDFFRIGFLCKLNQL
jgi:glycosyltransferase involved in cell wall biosynthesis